MGRGKKGSKNKSKTVKEIGTENFKAVTQAPTDQVDYRSLEGTVVTPEGNTEGLSTEDQTLIRAGINPKDKPNPMVDKRTVVSEGGAPVPTNKKKDVFNREPEVKSTAKSMSHSGTVVTKLN